MEEEKTSEEALKHGEAISEEKKIGEPVEKLSEEPVKQEEKKEEQKPKPKEPRKPFNAGNFYLNIKNFYDKQYKRLLIIPSLMLLLAIIAIGFQIAETGDFINKDVSLKGGVTLTIPLEKEVNILELQDYLSSQFKGEDISVRALSRAGAQFGILVEAGIDGTKQLEIDSLISSISSSLQIKLAEDDYSIEIMGSSLGASFFKELLIALLIAFLLMGIIVFIYFRTIIPSLAVILAAFSDIVVTLAVINLLGMKVGTGGIAAFLMLIGYSVDTDILLTTRVLKRKEGTVMDKVISSIKTGVTMTLTAIVAVIVTLILTQSDVIKQIMMIILIGLLVDLVSTWIQNVGILRLYLEHQHKKHAMKNE
ncbi:protein translocase subunit SecF [Candidatus Woesearchaeota archaeon]|nr:protein translocase subunit SecF [Candidatus Woesearchaeota archaeon]